MMDVGDIIIEEIHKIIISHPITKGTTKLLRFSSLITSLCKM